MPAMVGPTVGSSSAKQPLDSTLTALTALNSSAGLVEETGADLFTKRPIGVASGSSIPTRSDADTRYSSAVHSHPESDITNLVADLSAKAPVARSISTTAPLTGGGTLAADRTIAITDFVASGASHARGAVPDTPGAAGSVKFLREDATWSVPIGGVVLSTATVTVTAPSFDWLATITDAAVSTSPASKILITDGTYSDSDENAPGDVEYSVVSLAAGSFNVRISSRSNSAFFGVHRFVYAVG